VSLCVALKSRDEEELAGGMIYLATSTCRCHFCTGHPGEILYLLAEDRKIRVCFLFLFPILITVVLPAWSGYAGSNTKKSIKKCRLTRPSTVCFKVSRPSRKLRTALPLLYRHLARTSPVRLLATYFPYGIQAGGLYNISLSRSTPAVRVLFLYITSRL
jgi:hypothetical protein